LGREARLRLEPVAEVGGSLLERPLLHRVRHLVRDRGVQLGAAADGLVQRLEDGLGQLLLHGRDVERVGAEYVAHARPARDLRHRPDAARGDVADRPLPPGPRAHGSPSSISIYREVDYGLRLPTSRYSIATASLTFTIPPA